MLLLSVYIFLGGLTFVGGLIVAFKPVRYLQALSLLIALAAAFGLVLVFLSQGVYFNADGYFGDFWTATEAINKTRDGHLSSVDYFSPIGPVYSYVYALWLLIDPNPTAVTVLHASALAALIIALLGFVMLRRQISPVGLSIVIFSIVGIAVSGRGNGEILLGMPMHYVAPYNRWAWACFIPVVVRLAIPRGKTDPWGDLVLGVAIGLLLMLKVTYGAATLGLVLARPFLVPGSWREWPLNAVGLIAVIAAIEVTTGQVRGNLQDLHLTSQLPQSGLRLPKLFVQLGEASIYSLAAFIIYFATLPRTAGRQDLRPIFLILLVAGAGCAVLMQNHYSVEAAVYPLLLLIAFEWNRHLHFRPVASALRERVLTAGAIAAILFYPAIDIGMHIGQRAQFVFNGPDPAFDGTPYASLRFEPYLIDSEGSLLNTVPDGRLGVLEGFNMLQEVGADQPNAGRIVALAFANPFPMMLGQPSPVGAPIWLHEGRSFSEDVFVPAQILFAGVDYVMTPIEPSLLESIYADTLKADFTISQKGDFWTLRVRKADVNQ